MAETRSNKTMQSMLAIIFIVILLNSCFNLVNFPSYYWSEGVYLMRSLNFIKEGLVYSDPSFIDHPPLGWIIPSIFYKVFDFPNSVVGTQMPSSMYDVEQKIFLLALVPRLIGVIFTMITALLVYKISLVLYGNRKMAMISLASFAMIPAMWPLRNLQLDPIMIMFVLLSLSVLLPKGVENNRTITILEKRVLARIVISGIFFGTALLVKLTAIFFFPAIILFAMGYGLNLVRSNQPNFPAHPDNSVAVQITRKQRILSGILWLTPVLGFLFSLLLFFIINQHTISNLVSTQLWQVSRQSLLPLWIALPLLFVASPIGLFFGIIGLAKTLLCKDKLVWGVAGVPYLAFLFRGGYIEWTHVIPMLPLLSIYAGKPIYELAEHILCRIVRSKTPNVNSGKLMNYFIIGLTITSLVITIWVASFDETKPSRDAVQFLISNLPKNAILVTDPGYGWMVSILRPDVNVTDYYTLNNMSNTPDSFYIVQRPGLIPDPALQHLETLFQEACPIKEFINDPSSIFFHPYSLFQDKWWDIIVKDYNIKGCKNP